MTTQLFAGKTLEVDADGYLAHSQDWNEGIAQAIATQEGLPALTDEHWKVIRFMRRIYAERGDGPSIRQLTKESGVDTKSLYRLFPNGPAKRAARIAGIPKPHGCI
jgi:tRNA 2-thiouridine synthesizing protein E